MDSPASVGAFTNMGYFLCDCGHPTLEPEHCDDCKGPICCGECNLGTRYYRTGDDKEKEATGVLCEPCYEGAKETLRELEP